MTDRERRMIEAHIRILERNAADFVKGDKPVSADRCRRLAAKLRERLA